MNRHLPHALLHQINWSGMRWCLLQCYNVFNDTSIIVDAHDVILIIHNGKTSSYCYITALAVTHSHVLSNLKHNNLTLWLIIHTLIMIISHNVALMCSKSCTTVFCKLIYEQLKTMFLLVHLYLCPYPETYMLMFRNELVININACN